MLRDYEDTSELEILPRRNETLPFLLPASHFSLRTGTDRPSHPRTNFRYDFITLLDHPFKGLRDIRHCRSWRLKLDSL